MNVRRSARKVAKKFIEKKRSVIVTLDLRGATPEDYKILDGAMANWGLYKFTPTAKNLPLPNNTYMGKFGADVDAVIIRDSLKNFLRERKGLKVNAILGGVLENWAAKKTRA